MYISFFFGGIAVGCVISMIVHNIIYRERD